MSYDVNRLVGARIKSRRIETGLSKAELASQISVDENEVALFERAEASVSVATLFKICHALRSPLSYFFSGDFELLSYDDPSDRTRELRPASEDVQFDYEKIWLLNSFYKITDPDIRISIVKLVEKISTSPRLANELKECAAQFD